VLKLPLKFNNHYDCRLCVGSGAVESLPDVWEDEWQAAAVIGDSNVIGLFGEQIEKRLRPLVEKMIILQFEPGEQSKTRRVKEKLEDSLLDAGFDRSTCVLALGGGISIDLAGMVAATFMRGVPTVNLPTTLLAQVDAAIGGKTGVNTRHGKNLVGVFHQPSAVLVDTNLLDTLTPDEWRNGMAEAVKHAVIADGEFFGWIEANVPALLSPHGVDSYLVQRCIEIKSAIVMEDERELGQRATLNFGHTVAHAIEGATSFSVSHGLAVAAGMVVEAGVAVEKCDFSSDSLRRLRRLLESLLLLPKLDLGFNDVNPFFKADKKRRDGRIRMSLPASLGRMARNDEEYTLSVEPELIHRSWRTNLCKSD